MNLEDDLKEISSIGSTTINTFGKHGGVLIKLLFKYNPKAYINLLRESFIQHLNDCGIEDGDTVNVFNQLGEFINSAGPTSMEVQELKRLGWESLDNDFEIDFTKIKIGLKRKSISSDNYEAYVVYPSELIKKNGEAGISSYIFYEFVLSGRKFEISPTLVKKKEKAQFQEPIENQYEEIIKSLKA